MRLLPILALLATPALSDTIEAPGPVTAVTLYPSGATVTRTVTFTAPAGTHDIVVPGLPYTLAAEGLRVTAPEGVVIGAISLAEARPPATGDQKPPAVLAAEAEVARLDAVLRDKRRDVAGIRAHAESAEARAAFLQSLARAQGERNLTAAGVDDLRALAQMIDEEVLSVRQTVLAVEAEAIAAEIALEPDVEALAKARGALEALVAPEGDAPQVLTVSAQVATAGEVVLTVDGLSTEAGWSPVYDMRLTRKPDALAVTRGVVVRQDTGEDWRRVDLTLSTAQPTEQSEPSRVWPNLRRIESEVELARRAKAAALEEGVYGGLAEPAMEPAVVVTESRSGFGFDTSSLGQVFTFRFGAPVDVRAGADALRLVMDDVAPEVELVAEAVPRNDNTAFLVADLTNTTGQPLLPGLAVLYSEGALVGGTELPLVAPGADTKIGFGAIDGIRLTRTVPGKTEGEEGFFAQANRQEETAILTIENLTAEAWPLRVTDRVPYSEQDDLVVTWTATPPVTEDSPKGQRGVLVWEFDLAAGGKQEIRLDSRMEWPEGMVLQ